MIVAHYSACPALCQRFGPDPVGRSFALAKFCDHFGPDGTIASCHACTCPAQSKLRELVIAVLDALKFRTADDIAELDKESLDRLTDAIAPFYSEQDTFTNRGKP